MHKPHLKDGVPDLSQPKVKKQVQAALGCALACFSPSPHPWSSTFINRHIGDHRTKLGRWLRSALITCVDDHFSFEVGNSKAGQVKQWVLNEDGVDQVKRLLGYVDRKVHQPLLSPLPAIGIVGAKCVINDTLSSRQDEISMDTLLHQPLPYLRKQVRLDSDIDTLLISRWAQTEFGQEMKHLVFEYEDKSSRLWHPLQMMRRAHKLEVQAAAGLTWHYDIEACAPTLLLQHAQSLPEPMDLWLEHYTTYLSDRASQRERLAQVMECDTFFAKTAINAILCGAQIGAGERFAIGRLLHHPVRVKRFKEDDFIIGLRRDIKTMWDYIHPAVGYHFRENGRRIPLSPKRKWHLYFRLERKVLDVVRAYLTETGNPHFLEHDGWVTRDKVDTAALTERIYQQTGFSVKLEEEKYRCAFMSALDR